LSLLLEAEKEEKLKDVNLRAELLEKGNLLQREELKREELKSADQDVKR